jgi:hypothetical protein
MKIPILKLPEMALLPIIQTGSNRKLKDSIELAKKTAHFAEQSVIKISGGGKNLVSVECHRALRQIPWGNRQTPRKSCLRGSTSAVRMKKSNALVSIYHYPRHSVSMLVYPWMYRRRCGGRSAKNCLPASGISHGTSME